jgi:hypothetical protein
VSASIEFIVDLEKPSVGVEVIGYQLGQTLIEINWLMDISTANSCRHFTEIKDSLRS